MIKEREGEEEEEMRRGQEEEERGRRERGGEKFALKGNFIECVLCYLLRILKEERGSSSFLSSLFLSNIT